MTTPPHTHREVADTRWGRRPGAVPPLPSWAPAAFAAVLAVLLTLVVVLVVRPAGPLDQADLADQRDGLLLDGPVVGQAVQGVQFGDVPVVLLFVREAPSEAPLAAWAAEVPDAARVVLVVQGEGASATTPAGIEVVADPEQRLAAAVDLPEPNAGGAGIGYAVVDSDRVVRYSTLDPAWAANAVEVATIAGAVS